MDGFFPIRHLSVTPDTHYFITGNILKVTDMDLYEYRKFKYISVKKASEELGISRQHIYDIEKGKSFPSRKLSVKICKWSNGFVTQLELLFPDLSKSVKDNLVKLDNWEEKEKRNKKRTFHDVQIMRNI